MNLAYESALVADVSNGVFEELAEVLSIFGIGLVSDELVAEVAHGVPEGGSDVNLYASVLGLLLDSLLDRVVGDNGLALNVLVGGAPAELFCSLLLALLTVEVVSQNLSGCGELGSSVYADVLVTEQGDELLVGAVNIDGGELRSAEVVAESLLVSVGVPGTVNACAQCAGGETGSDLSNVERGEGALVLMHESGECLQSLDCFVLVILYELLGYAVFLKTVDLNASGERIGAGIVAVAAVEDELLAGILTSGEDILELACLVLGSDSLVVYEIVAVIVGLVLRLMWILQSTACTSRLGVPCWYILG